MSDPVIPPVDVTVDPGRQGDFWTAHVWRFKFLTGSNFWTGARVIAQLKTSPTAPVTYAFVLAPVVTLVSGYDVLTVRLDIPAPAARKIPAGTYFCDIEVSSNTLHPVTLATFTLPWTADISHP